MIVGKIRLPKTKFVHHCEINQHNGILTQAPKFHEDSPHVSCFIVGTFVSHIDIAMRGSLNFKKLHQGYWGVARLLGVFNNFMLE